MAKQAKCAKCKIRFTWNKVLPLPRARCVLCGEPLAATTHQSRLEVRDLGRLLPLGKERRMSMEYPRGERGVHSKQFDKLIVMSWKRKIEK